VQTLRRGQKWILRLDTEEYSQVSHDEKSISALKTPKEIWYQVNNTWYVKWAFDIYFETKEDIIAWYMINT